MSDHGNDAPDKGAGYNVGYRKPPTHSRFQKGSSGNPKGRPPASKNLATLLTRALDAWVIVTENGKRKKKSMRDIIIAQLVNKSAKADLRAMAMLLGMIEKFAFKEQAAAAGLELTTESFSEADAKVMDSLRARLASGGGQNNE